MQALERVLLVCTLWALCMLHAYLEMRCDRPSAEVSGRADHPIGVGSQGGVHAKKILSLELCKSMYIGRCKSCCGSGGLTSISHL